MKKILFFFVASCIIVSLPAQSLVPVDAASSVKFTIKNFGLKVDGSMKGLQGKIIFNPANLATASFTVSVDAASINTNNGTRDSHLKKEEYFDVANHPRVQFISSKISSTNKPMIFKMEGNVTIKGISKLVSFPFTIVEKPDGYNFLGEFTINRRDFKVGGSSWVLSDNLIVSLSVFAKR
jgi:polyisoprenoid-binding protein YceI